MRTSSPLRLVRQASAQIATSVRRHRSARRRSDVAPARRAIAALDAAECETTFLPPPGRMAAIVAARRPWLWGERTPPRTSPEPALRVSPTGRDGDGTRRWSQRQGRRPTWSEPWRRLRPRRADRRRRPRHSPLAALVDHESSSSLVPIPPGSTRLKGHGYRSSCSTRSRRCRWSVPEEVREPHGRRPGDE